MGTAGETVLVVDDDPGCRELHELWLAPEYEVLTASGGAAALELAERAEVVLLDREMPDVDGETVARRIDEAPIDPFVVMLSGVEPDFDIVDLPIDEYLIKPVSKETVTEVVDDLFARLVTRRLLREYYSLRARKRVLEDRKRPRELAHSDAYQRLTARVETKRVAVEEMLAEIDPERREALVTEVAEAMPASPSASV